MKITVLGSGGWGTALALLLLENGNDVTLWSYHQAESDTLRTTHENPLLKGVVIPEEMKFTCDLAAVKGCGLVVMATPSFAVRSTAAQVKDLLDPGTIVVSVSKGIEKDSSLRLSQVIQAEIGDKCPVVVLSGPSHAEEVGRHIPTGVVAAADDPKIAEQVQDLVMNQRFRVYTSDDKIGTEICAALKNIIALCAGCCDGMGFGDNTKAALMTRGLSEIARLGEKLGGDRLTFGGLAGMGDLIVTCTSMHSRNRRAGILIGQGESAQQAMKEVGAVVEGYYAALSVEQLAQREGVEMPICHCVYEVLYHGKPARDVVGELMNRSRKEESGRGWQYPN